jgi:hypothetical protein
LLKYFCIVKNYNLAHMKKYILSIVLAFGFIAFANASSNEVVKLTDVDVGYVIQSNDFNSVVNFEQAVIKSDFEIQNSFTEIINTQKTFCEPFRTEKDTRSWCSYSINDVNYKTEIKDCKSKPKNCLVYFDDHPKNS